MDHSPDPGIFGGIGKLVLCTLANATFSSPNRGSTTDPTFALRRGGDSTPQRLLRRISRSSDADTWLEAPKEPAGWTDGVSQVGSERGWCPFQFDW
mmetsp:Transcript_34448/g.65557  ORF Transcript_34448/g.65557 Transcript_34448/m.65557 type:complete len:96 (-) Transcript_34448:1664-1951(-)